MKTNPSLRAAALLVLASATPSGASVAVVSNLEQAGLASHMLRGADGELLPAGCPVRLATFPGRSTAEIRELASAGWSSLLDAADLFGEPATVGTGTGEPGTIEFQSGSVLTEALEGLHVMVSNADGSENLVLSLPAVMPADDLAGPARFIAVHLDEAAVVFGERSEAGFSTAVAPVIQPSAYEAWILGELGADRPEIDLAPEGDADRDGVVNLIEYATGSKPGDGSSLHRLFLRRAPDDVIYLQYLRRTDDPSLAYTVESKANGGSGPWVVLGDVPLAPAVLPSPPPSSLEWVELPLPAVDSLMARLRVEILPE